MQDSGAYKKRKRRDPSVDLGLKVLVLFGTRPEAIKLAPIIHELRKRFFQTIVVTSSQHRELLKPFLKMLCIETDFNLGVMRKNQSPNEVCSRVLAKLDKILLSERPDLIVVQGDTSTALAGALAGFNRRIPVAHVEAGLRSGSIHSPFPEEMNRRVISQIAAVHFAATEANRGNLLSENVASERIFVTGNPVVDSLNAILKMSKPNPEIARLLESTEGMKRILLTTHRRESFGDVMGDNLRVLRDFVHRHQDVCLFFPVHPNPNVRQVTEETLAGKERVFLLEPLDYVNFVTLMKSVWLIVSDSGGVQEEAPSLGKPLLVLRENTERPEAIRAGVAKLIGGNPANLNRMLEENYSVETWIKSVSEVANPFGDGKAAPRIVKIIEERLSSLHRGADSLGDQVLQSSFH
ncbi:MAG: UDP-N-acetylglucosamine 2-epimerase (non-hydrolyzing) [Acidobacteria bacterium]|nr:UDP-N-acetylglucosamine 2-epimerase (non-hydrolyzing) [Acidobacteriota bacterium]